MVCFPGDVTVDLRNIQEQENAKLGMMMMIVFKVFWITMVGIVLIIIAIIVGQ